MVTPATLAVIGNAGGHATVGVGPGGIVVKGVAPVAPVAFVAFAPPRTASATVVAARNMRSIGTSGGYRAPMTEVVAGAALGLPVADEDCPARVT
ncbi:hypothetical protein [Micromonospora sp. WMMC250]|uniref:hypothetical protein n=1 Tax=Micromonospora sp. WMMC250 TaxID=3014781 RepID=UPI0022B744A6|nr:hypothetical protein [Micromonospora sp. WMMC250]MCZ7375037.1 hypothetical protein [Micromonospora sp. WMMC250]